MLEVIAKFVTSSDETKGILLLDKERRTTKLLPLSKSVEYIKKYGCVNASISIDGKLLQKSSGFEKLVVDDTHLFLWHGSKQGINGMISCDKSREDCDFGKGFYTGEYRTQAEGRICDNEQGVLYSLYVDTSKMRVYKFEDAVKWAFYIGVKRHFIMLETYPKLREFVEDIDNYDLIIGDIADDRIQEVFPQYINNFIKDVELIECLKMIRLGKQYVFKTNSSCSNIRILSEEYIDNKNRQRISQMNKNMRTQIPQKMMQLKLLYKNSGNYFIEDMEQYK